MKTLRTQFIIVIALTLLWIVLNENDVFEWVGTAHRFVAAEFLCVTLMELLTICSIPVALRLFKFRWVQQHINRQPATAQRNYYRWALMRQSWLLLLLVANATLYYPFMNVAFGYMGIILGLALLFVFPTEERYQSEYKMLTQTNEPEK